MTVAATFTIRPGTPDDAHGLAELGARTFRDTYSAETRSGDMDAFLADAFRADALAEELADDRHRWLVAEVDRSAVGYAHLVAREDHASIVARSPVLLGHLYLDRSVQGIGLGSALMGQALDTARDDAHDVIWLGVWERNPRAIDFYRRWGFLEVGSIPFSFGAEHHRDLVMGRSLRTP